jgi:hypothetical protein
MNFFSSIRNWLVDDIGWKVFSLILAIVVWATAHRILLETGQPAGANSGGPVIYGNLPVNIVSSAADVRDFRLLQSYVSVTVTGSAEAVGKLQANQIHATVDVSDLSTPHPEKQHVDVSVPLGITVVSVKPDSIGVIAPTPQN